MVIKKKNPSHPRLPAYFILKKQRNWKIFIVAFHITQFLNLLHVDLEQMSCSRFANDFPMWKQINSSFFFFQAEFLKLSIKIMFVFVVCWMPLSTATFIKFHKEIWRTGVAALLFHANSGQLCHNTFCLFPTTLESDYGNLEASDCEKR